MPKTIFKKRALASCIAMAVASGVYAQDDAPEVEEVLVTGIRASLDRAMDIKRDSTGVVDAISAEDMGKFPDTNLAESLQRIPGVSIDRSNGEGSKITVRGFGPQFNLVTLNNRQVPVDTGDRSFDFGNVASELVSGVEVYKTGLASLPTGGIGATVNIKTAKPLDNPGQQAAVGLKLVDDSSTKSGSSTTEFSGLYSNTFADDTFGVLVALSIQEREGGVQRAEIANGWRHFGAYQHQEWGAGYGQAEWGGVPGFDGDGNIAGGVNRPSPTVDGTTTGANNESEIYSVPQAMGYYMDEFQRERTNGQLVLQFAPNDDITLTGDVTVWEKTTATQGRDISAWFTFAPSQSVWSDGPVSTPLIYSENYGNPTDGPDFQDISMGAHDFADKKTATSVGFNVEWQATDALSFDFDLHSSTAKTEPDSIYGSSNVLSTAAFLRSSAAVDVVGGDFPTLYVGNASNVTPQDMHITGGVFGATVNESDVTQFQVNGSFEFNESGSIDFGISNMVVNNHSQSTNVQRNDWGGIGRANGTWRTESADISSALASVEDVLGNYDGSPGSFNNGGYGLTADAQGFLTLDAQTSDLDPLNFIYTWDMPTLTALGAAITLEDAQLQAAANGGTWEDYYPDATQVLFGDCGTQFCMSSNYPAGTDRETEETNTALYFQANFENEIQGMTSNLSAGLRYEATDVESTLRTVTYTEATWVADTEIPMTYNLQNEATMFEGDGKYDYVLPNINFDIEVAEDMIVRASYSKTLGRPGYQEIQGGANYGNILNQGGGSGTQGNPNLKPLISDNIDLSFEWYYDESSYASIGYFRKDTINFIVYEQEDTNLAGIYTPIGGDLYNAALDATGSADAGTIRDYIFANNADNACVDAANERITGCAANNDPLAEFTVGTPTNSGERGIDGFELAVQHVFGESGFGFQFNYTKTNKGLSADVTTRDPQVALTGLSDTYNIVAFYENYGISARLAYNWRESFLYSLYELDNDQPLFFDDYAQIDMNVSYDIPGVEGLNVFLEGINIGDESLTQYSRQESTVRNYIQQSARWNLGVRYKL